MSLFRSISLTLFFAAFVSSSIAMTMAQGNSAGRGNGPKVAPPAHGAPPSVPPGQAKQSPAAPPQANGPKPVVTPIVVKPALSAKLQPLLPVGLTVDAASAGFKNLGQFVAAVHVAKNLDIPFTTLKTEMVVRDRSLGQAIQTLKPAVNTTNEVAKAEGQARVDIDSRR